MKIEKYQCDKCKKEIGYDEWLYDVGDIAHICANNPIGSMELSGGHYCTECYRKAIKELYEREFERIMEQ